jgi:hypothetical protein
VTQTAAPPRRKSFLPIVGGIAAVIAAAVVVPMVMKGNGKQTATNPPASVSSPPADTSKAGGGPPANGTQQQATSPDPSGGSAPPASNAGRSQSGGVTIAQELARVEQDAQNATPTNRAGLLGRLDALDRRTSAREDSINVVLVRYKVYLNSGDEGEACASLKKVKDRAVGTSLESKVNDRLEACP